MTMMGPGAPPLMNHQAHMDQLAAKMGGKTLSQAAPDVVAPPPVVEEPKPAAPVVEAAPEPVVEAPVAEAPPASAPKAVPPPPAKNKLARSMEIQRRAEEATRRARAEAGKLRTQPAPEAPKKPEPSPEAVALEAQKQEVAKLQQQYQAAVRLAQTDPMGFAKRHGVSPAELARYVAEGQDPTVRAIEQIRRETQQEIANVRKEAAEQINAVRDSMIASQEVDAQRNFFTFVEESKDANPEAFAALQSGLVFSDKDIWDTANHLLETRPDLRDNFDEDRLLEAVEAEARKDPRWTRVQALTKASSKQKQSNVQAAKKPNVSEKEEVVEEPQEAPTTTKTAPKRDPMSGQFVQQPKSPYVAHAEHFERLVRNVRLG